MAEKKCAKKSSKSSKFFLGAALGAVAGAVAGVLMAPKSGKETRKDIKDGAKKATAKAKTTAKKAVKSGNFDMLYEHIKCPYCGAEQKWKYRYGRAITFAILALATVAIDILCIIIYSKQVRRGETDKTFLLCAF